MSAPHPHISTLATRCALSSTTWRLAAGEDLILGPYALVRCTSWSKLSKLKGKATILGPDANRPGVRATLWLSGLTPVMLEFPIVGKRTIEIGCYCTTSLLLESTIRIVPHRSFDRKLMTFPMESGRGEPSAPRSRPEMTAPINRRAKPVALLV